MQKVQYKEKEFKDLPDPEVLERSDVNSLQKKIEGSPISLRVQFLDSNAEELFVMGVPHATSFPLLPMSQLRLWNQVTYIISTTLCGVPIRNVEIYDLQGEGNSQEHKFLHTVRRKTKRKIKRNKPEKSSPEEESHDLAVEPSVPEVQTLKSEPEEVPSVDEAEVESK